MDTSTYSEQLTSLRRELHRTPEIGWSEFVTTARVIGLLRGDDLVNTAMTAMTLDQLSSGRFLLGLGLSGLMTPIVNGSFGAATASRCRRGQR